MLFGTNLLLTIVTWVGADLHALQLAKTALPVSTTRLEKLDRLGAGAGEVSQMR